MLQNLSESKNTSYTSSSKIWVEMDDLQLPAYFMKKLQPPYRTIKSAKTLCVETARKHTAYIVKLWIPKRKNLSTVLALDF